MAEAWEEVMPINCSSSLRCSAAIVRSTFGLIKMSAIDRRMVEDEIGFHALNSIEVNALRRAEFIFAISLPTTASGLPTQCS